MSSRPPSGPGRKASTRSRSTWSGLVIEPRRLFLLSGVVMKPLALVAVLAVLVAAGCGKKSAKNTDSGSSGDPGGGGGGSGGPAVLPAGGVGVVVNPGGALGGGGSGGAVQAVR